MAYGPSWILFVIFSIIVILFSIILVRYYADKHQSEKLTKIVTIFTLFIPVLIICIIPLDIYSLRYDTDHSSSLKAGYYVIFILIMIFSFFVIPFAYFYFESEDEDITTKKKVLSAMRYTAFTLVIIFILLLVGLLASPGSVPDSGSKNWKDAMFGNESAADSGVLFPIGCLTLLGCYLFLVYTSYGMGAMPIFLLKGKQAGGNDYNALDEVEEIHDRMMALESKETLSGKPLSKKEKKELDSLKRKERILNHRNRKEEEPVKGRFDKAINCIKTSSRIFGVIFILITVFFLISFLISLIERPLKSECGWRCGFVLKEPSKNIFDLLMVGLAKGFPMDFIFYFIFSTYILFTTIAGIVRISTRFLWIKMYSLRKHASPDQGLLLTGLFIMMIALVLVFEFISIAPQYMTFGIGLNEKGNQCTLSDVGVVENKCRMSMISTLVGRISVKMPFFAIVYYAVDWLFVILVSIFIFIGIKKKPKNIFAGNRSDSDSDFD
ncbi:lysosomal cobalamin transporter-related [Anaeramoeba flamelloides]|uniref:Lysosomal cobalamin transporter-related n=1 Tax=Anaeramoeba flamelloides TaxID=1746091 RepID=A0AAV7ZCB2_9EUKA|nr:lysosomal cobalamin transporter-related [Anaeramoeba flamelloides]KAJ6244975.1 lysosomal cobalamin transporter-related [Anaeramoeba flamelloides]